MANQYVGNNLIELVKHLGEAQMSRQMTSCEGLITSVDQTTYMAKVMLMPWEIETGWLPIGTIAAGPGWGFFHLPPDNTEVTVDFIGGDPDNGRIRCCYSNDIDAPPTDLEQNEYLLIHESGSKLYFDADGNVTLVAAGTLTVQSEGDLTVQGSGDVTVTGASVTLGDETTIDGVAFLTHTHEGVQSGPEMTGPVVA